MSNRIDIDNLLSPGAYPGDSPLIGRFAPSPSGRMHAGNIFSALVSWIICKRSGGGVVLRIEDLDRSRSKKEHAGQIMRDFCDLGLEWDFGPFYQSNRDEVYQQAFQAIEVEDLVYPCYCTRADLHAASAPHAGEKPVYAGTCRLLSPEELSAKAAKAKEDGRSPSYRIIVPDARYSLCDMFQGEYSQELSTDCGDFVIRRADGAFAYQLAVVLDDAEQGVNFIARGVDLLSSTPQQMYLQDVLGLSHPDYAHVPLMMGLDGHRLSKRHKDADYSELLVRFGSSNAVLGHIAWLAGMIDEDEPASPQDLLRYADLRPLVGRDHLLWA